MLVVIVATGVTGQCVLAAPLVNEALVIGEDSLVYHGKKVTIPIKRKNLIKVFGPPSREIYNAAGSVLIWDDLGLNCYGCQEPDPRPEEFEYMSPEEKKAYKPIDQIGALTIYVRKYNPYPQREKKYNHEPHFPFPGYIDLDGVEIDGVTTIKQFLNQRHSKQTILLPDNSFSFYIRCKPAPQEITLYSIRDSYSDDDLSVYAVSIRNVGQFYKKLSCRENFEMDEQHRLEQKRLDEEKMRQNIQGPLPVPAGEN
jgi:hypothetical protein